MSEYAVRTCTRLLLSRRHAELECRVGAVDPGPSARRPAEGAGARDCRSALAGRQSVTQRPPARALGAQRRRRAAACWRCACRVNPHGAVALVLSYHRQNQGTSFHLNLTESTRVPWCCLHRDRNGWFSFREDRWLANAMGSVRLLM